MAARIRLISTLVTVFTLALAATPTPARADAPTAAATPSVRDRFAGQFVYAGGEPQRAQVEAAIERAIEGMFFVAKPIARGKLRDKTEIKPHIGFSFAHASITSTASGVAPATSPDDGTAISYVAAGESLKLSQKLTPSGHLVQTFAAAEGTRTNDYVLSADGSQLTVAVTISSSKLPRPVRYVLGYRRT